MSNAEIISGDWSIVVGDWRDYLVAIHGPNGLIACGLDAVEARKLVNAHNTRPAKAVQGDNSEWVEDCKKWLGGAVLKGRFSHWCIEWDDLPVDETCPEFKCCNCFDTEDTKPYKDLLEKAFPNVDTFPALTPESEGIAGKGEIERLKADIATYVTMNANLNARIDELESPLTRPQEIDVEQLKREVVIAQAGDKTFTDEAAYGVSVAIDHLAQKGYLSAPAEALDLERQYDLNQELINGEKELMAVIQDQHITLMGVGIEPKYCPEYAAIIAEAQKGKQ